LLSPGVVAEDLEQFAKHAKRTTIRPDEYAYNASINIAVK